MRTTLPQPPRAALAVFFALTFGTYAYFHQGGGPNQFSRFALTRALVERTTVTIDAEHGLTFDKAFKDGHFYCDKAPGLSLLAAPGYALVRPWLERWAPPGSWTNVNLSLYAMTVLTVSLPTALAMTLFLRRAWREAGAGTGLGIAVALALGSPVAVWASLFYSHALAAALLWLAFDLVADGATSFLRALLAGLCAGAAMLSEFPAALVVLLIGLSLFGRWRALLGYGFGGLPALVALVAYNLAAFGAPLASGYQYHYVPEFREAMSAGVMGVTGPTLDAVIGSFVSRSRGLFLFWPFFLLVPVAAVIGAATVRGQGRGAHRLALAVVIVYATFGCSYYLWSGGCSYGPRHLVPCLPFAAYLVVRSAGPLRRAIPLLAALSVAVTLVASATLVEFPEAVDTSAPERDDPLFRMALPRFLAGNLSVKKIARAQEGRFEWPEEAATPDDPSYWDACNLGEVLGLRGLPSLAPLGAWWLLGGLLLRRAALVRRRPRSIMHFSLDEPSGGTD